MGKISKEYDKQGEEMRAKESVHLSHIYTPLFQYTNIPNYITNNIAS